LVCLSASFMQEEALCHYGLAESQGAAGVHNNAGVSDSPLVQLSLSLSC
jgi:hypothetical protein